MGTPTSVRDKLTLPAGFLARIRTYAQLTQSDLATDSGLGVSTITRAERANAITQDAAGSIGSAYSRHLGFQIDMLDMGQVSRLDALLLNGEMITAERAKVSWPIILPNGISPDRNVVGRAELLTTLVSEFRARAPAIKRPIMTLRGKPGVGKSTLARTFIDKQSSLFLGIWWCRAQNMSDLVEDLCQLADRLDLPPWNFDRPKDRALAAVNKIAIASDPWLIVFDNAENPAMISSFVPRIGDIFAIATTREIDWPSSKFKELEIDVLDPQSAEALLRQEACWSEEKNLRVSELVVDNLGSLPLALVHAGAWFRDTPNSGVEEYLGQLRNVIEHKPETIFDYSESVYAAIMISVQKLSESAQAWIEVLAFFAPDRIVPEDFENLVDSPNVNSRMRTLPMAFSNKEAVHLNFAEMRRRGLLDRNGKEYSIHRVTQLVVRSSLPEDSWNECVETAAGVLCRAYPSPEEIHGSLESLKKLGEHNRNVFTYLRDCAAAAKLRILSWYEADFQRDDDRALEIARSAVRLNEQFLTQAEMDLGVAQNNLGVTLWRTGDLDGALVATAKASALAEATIDKSVDHGIWMGVHGIVLAEIAKQLSEPHRFNKLAIARAQHLRAIRIFNNITGSRKNRYTATALTHLANMRAFQGAWGPALRLYGLGLRIRRNLLAGTDPDLGYSCINLAMALLESGQGAAGYRGENAIDLLQKGLKVRESAFAERPKHPERIAAARWLARAYFVLPESKCSPLSEVASKSAARLLCDQYELNETAIHIEAADFIMRMHLFEAGGVAPPLHFGA